MTPGQLARKLLGPLFPMVGRAYRSFGVDLEKVAQAVPRLPAGSLILDIGGGDGDLLNFILALNPGVRVTMIDLAPAIGAWIAPGLRERVEILPATSVRAYAEMDRPAPDLVLLSDVIHHVPVSERVQFLKDVSRLVDGNAMSFVIKEVEPGSFRSKLLFWADRYISGDKNVRFLHGRDLEQLVRETLPVKAVQATDLLQKNPPNYALIFSLEGPAAS